MILTLGTTPALQRTLSFARLRVDDVNRAAEVRQTPSGKSLNVARVLRALGEDVRATGLLGGDTGRTVRAGLNDAGVRHDFVEVAPPTRICTTLLDRAAGTATELVEEPQPPGPAAYARLTQKAQELLGAGNVAALILSGSLPPDAPADFYRKLVLIADHAGVRTVIDATGEPLKQAIAARPFLVKPNRRELAQTVNMTIDSDATLKAAVRKLIALGPKWAVITMGGDGAVASDGKSFWKVVQPEIEVVNPIGSGDSFTAGVTAAIARGREVPDALRLAAACGAANAMTDLAGFVRPADVVDLEMRTRVELW